MTKKNWYTVRCSVEVQAASAGGALTAVEETLKKRNMGLCPEAVVKVQFDFTQEEVEAREVMTRLMDQGPGEA